MGVVNYKNPLYWSETTLAHQTAKHSMDHRAQQEVEQVISGKDLEEVHGQAVRAYKQYSNLIHIASLFLNNINRPLKGIAVDMGSGTGVGACVLSKFDRISLIYAVEFSEQFVLQVMPITFEKFDADFEKIQPIVGDFNHLDLPDESVDIILDIDSFHHSEDLNFTFNECCRVLRPQGAIISVDRAWPDPYTRDHLNTMLNRELNENLKLKYGIPINDSFTRRDFGEHEYTIQEWVNSYQQIGFDVDVFSQWHPLVLNRIWLKLPITRLFTRLAFLRHKLGKRRHCMYGFNATRKLFVAVKNS